MIANLGEDNLETKALIADHMTWIGWLTKFQINHPKTASSAAGGNQFFGDGHGAWVRDYPDVLDMTYPGNCTAAHGRTANWLLYFC